MKKIQKNRHGSSILLALGFGIVLLIIVGGLRTFSSYRIQSSIREWNNLKASSLAEAGISMMLCQLGQDFSYETHFVNDNLTWGNTKGMTPKDFDSGGAISLSNQNDCFHGDISGVGNFQARCGVIPYQDDPSTKNIDESKAYLLLESIGCVNLTSRKISAVISRRFPGKECLLYDGDVLSIVYGEPGNGETNVFADGNLYGHNGVEIGDVTSTDFGSPGNGTKQSLKRVNRIMSGKGGVFFLNNVNYEPPSGGGGDITANMDWAAGKNFGAMAYPNNRKGKGEYPKEFLEAAPVAAESYAKEHIRDKNNPVIMTPAFLPLDYYKKLAQDVVTTSPTESHKTYTGGSANMVCLDFGDAIREGNGVAMPASEIFYSTEDIVIRGNPATGVTIVSAKSVYVDGDFNQYGEPPGTTAPSGKWKYGYNQDYQGNPKSYNQPNYKTGPGDPATLNDHTKICRILAAERVVFDYSDLRKCFGNELYPFFKYRLAKEIMGDDTKATNSFLKVGGDEKIEKTQTATYSYTTQTVETIPAPPSDDGSGYSGDDGGGDDGGYETEDDYSDFSVDDSASEADKKAAAIEEAKNLLLASAAAFLASPTAQPSLGCGLNWDDYKDELRGKITEDTSASPNEQTSDAPPVIVENADGSKTKTTTTTHTKTVTVKFSADGAWAQTFLVNIWKANPSEEAKHLNGEALKNLFTTQVTRFGGADQIDDYLFFPEFTTVGMFTSFGKRSPDDTFCAGPDFSKHFEEMGATVPMLSFIHRLYGSQANFRVNDMTGTGQTYNPPIRKKVYDTRLPLMGTANSSGKILDIPTYGILTFKELGAKDTSSF